jgi:hypothetical protein
MAIAARSGIVIIATANPGNAIAGIQTLLPERNAGESGLDLGTVDDLDCINV